MTELYLVRHGQSESNLLNIYAGHLDSPLSETGKIQAKLLVNYFKDIHIDAIVSSDLLRAYGTIFPTAKDHGIEIIKNRNLREIYAGQWEGVEFSVLEREYEKDYSVWLNDIPNAVCTGGESVRELSDRITNEMNKIIAEYDGKTVVVASHGMPIKVLCSIWKTGNLESIRDASWAPNASVTHILFTDGKPDIINEFDTSHLAGFLTNLPDNV